MGSGALGVSLLAGSFLADLGLSVTLGLEVVLELEALPGLAGVLAFEPSLGGALFTAGADMMNVELGEIKLQVFCVTGALTRGRLAENMK